MRSKSMTYIQIFAPENKLINNINKDKHISSKYQICTKNKFVRRINQSIFQESIFNEDPHYIRPDIIKLNFLHNDHINIQTQKQKDIEGCFFDDNNTITKAMLDYQYQQKPTIRYNWQSYELDSQELQKQNVSKIVPFSRNQASKREVDIGNDKSSIFNQQIRGATIPPTRFINSIVNEKDHITLIRKWKDKDSFI